MSSGLAWRILGLGSSYKKMSRVEIVGNHVWKDRDKVVDMVLIKAWQAGARLAEGTHSIGDLQ